MFSSLHARITRMAISPRLAISTFSNMKTFHEIPCLPGGQPTSRWANFEKGLAEFHRLGIFNEHLRNHSLGFGLDIIKYHDPSRMTLTKQTIKKQNPIRFLLSKGKA